MHRFLGGSSLCLGFDGYSVYIINESSESGGNEGTGRLTKWQLARGWG